MIDDPLDHPGCADCGRAFNTGAFPLARRRKDGTRGYYRFCAECLSRRNKAGKASWKGDREAMREAALAYKRRARALKATGFQPVDVYRTAIANMCAECEPRGTCWDPTCPLRPVSPFQLSAKAKERAAALARTSDERLPVFDPPPDEIEQVFDS